MNGFFKLNDPDEIEATLTVTMPIKDWKALRDKMVDYYPGWDFKNLINNAVNTAENRFFVNGEESK